MGESLYDGLVELDHHCESVYECPSLCQFFLAGWRVSDGRAMPADDDNERHHLDWPDAWQSLSLIVRRMEVHCQEHSETFGEATLCYRREYDSVRRIVCCV